MCTENGMNTYIHRESNAMYSRYVSMTLNTVLVQDLPLLCDLDKHSVLLGQTEKLDSSVMFWV